MAPIWYVVIGAPLIFMGLSGTAFHRLPLSAAMIYVAFGFLLGPSVSGMLHLGIGTDAHLLRTLTEVAVLISLFAVGLRLRVTPTDRIWLLPLRLGVLAMLATVGLLSIVAHWLLGLPWGIALLLAAILAPTDPVLAHDVQIQHPGDNDQVRFALSGEGGLNDGIAFPFVLLALALMARTGSGAEAGAGAVLGHAAHSALGWFGVRMLWGMLGGMLGGWLLGEAVGRLVVFLRSRYEQALGLEGFLTLGLIALTYGGALLLDVYGFLAVFAAGLAMRRVEHRAIGEQEPSEVMATVDMSDLDAAATDPERAPVYMTESVLGFTSELERIAEMTVMVVIGSMLSGALFSWSSALLVVVLFCVVRPLSVGVSLLGSLATRRQRRLMSWFGIRGVGSFYYVLYALENSAGDPAVARLWPNVLAVITASVLVHGISATPLMRSYRHAQEARPPQG